MSLRASARRVIDWLWEVWTGRSRSDGTAELVESYELIIAFRCPCGSKILHLVTFPHDTTDCRRCGRTIGVREMHYWRATTDLQPRVHFVIGALSR